MTDDRSTTALDLGSVFDAPQTRRERRAELRVIRAEVRADQRAWNRSRRTRKRARRDFTKRYRAAVRAELRGTGPITRIRAYNELHNATYVDLDGPEGLLGFTLKPHSMTKPHRLRALGAGIVAIGVFAALILVLLSPLLLGTSITVREARDYYLAMPSKLPQAATPTRSRILAADGSVIATFFSENRVNVEVDQIPLVMRDAIVAIEDSRFYDHRGVDVRGTARALVTNLLTNEVQGGSTITQQYVKNVLATAADSAAERDEVTSRSSYLRKLREAKLAVKVEQQMTKNQILAAYLNIAYFGDGAYGIGTAADHFFSKDAKDLDLAEAALLAGLVQNPEGYNPTEHARDARQRRDVVLRRMLDLGMVSVREYKSASGSPVRLDLSQPANGCVSSRYPFFCQWVRQILTDDPAFGRTPAARNEFLYRGGLTIRTTLDPKAQDAAQAAVDASLGRSSRVAASAVTVVPGTGEVVAMAVNRTFGTPKPGSFDRTQVILPLAHSFQPGSNFKPFTLAAALERGFDPDTELTAPVTYTPANMNAPEGGFENAGSAEAGTFDAATALARSSNTWFVVLEEQVGVLNVASMAERLGITSLPRTGPRAITPRDASLTLGAYEVSPMEMAGAYATFAAEGVHCDPTPIASVEAPGPGGTRRDIEVPSANCHEAITPSVANTVADIMTGVIDGPDEYRTGSKQSLGRPAAGKTGTTQGNAAVWFSGYTPQYATSVAVMDPRGGFAHPLRGFYAGGQYIDKAYGSLVAGPIWKRIMLDLHRGKPVRDFAPPRPGVATATLVPDVRGLDLARAYTVLARAGYDVELAERTAAKNPYLSPDVVAYSEPAAGAYLGTASVVRLVMTDGSNLDIALPRD